MILWNVVLVAFVALEVFAVAAFAWTHRRKKQRR